MSSVGQVEVVSLLNSRFRRALKALLLANPKESALLAESVRRAVIGADDSEACSSRFFQVIVGHDT